MATDSAAKTRLRRTRTGCLKCRVRRRKCDEGKPACQRCLDAGFDCQYGTRLSFLEKNAITVTNPAEDARSSYSSLKFLEPAVVSPKSPDLQEESEQSHGDKSTASATGRSQTASNGNGNGFAESPIGVDAPNSLHFPLVTPSPQQPGYSQPAFQTPESYPIEGSPTNTAYETALNVLLSLGNNHLSTSPESQQIANTDWQFALQRHSTEHSPPKQPNKVTRSLEQLFPTCAHLPQEKAVQLLRHFRYSIAPWLDIGDSAQTFGLEVCRVAMNSVPVLASLLALSHASLDRNTAIDPAELGLTPEAPRNELSEIDILSSVVVFALVNVQKFLTTAPSSWQSPSSSIGLQALNNALAHESYPATRLAVSWVLLRLDISVGLITNSPVSIPNILPYGNTPLDASHVSRDFIKYDREPLLLCGKVLNHCFAPDTTQSSGLNIRPGTTQSWKALFEALNIWYSNRPQDFKPMLEIDESEQLFPQILFTNGAAVLANQIYHTGMLLLLQHRPRTLANELGRSTLASPLWHAQRVCGISLSNDSKANWDFSLVASFYLAAKRMTYEPQQRAILSGVDSIAAITGWNITALSAQLVKEWQPD